MLKTSLGSPGAGGAAFGGSDGKASQTQNLGSIHAPAPATITPGEPMSRMMGQYGKGHSYLPGADAGGAKVGAAAPSIAHPGANIIRGSGGGIRRPRQGGLGGGRMGAAASPARDYGASGDST